MTSGEIEQANEKYVLRALAETRDGAGVKGARTRANEFLKQDGERRRLAEPRTLAILESLTAQGKAAKQNTTPVTWLITPAGRKSL